MRLGPPYAYLCGQEQRGKVKGAGTAARAVKKGEGGEEGKMINQL